MTDAGRSISSSELRLSGALSSAQAAVRRELIGWAWLAVGALAVAGVFAILLAVSRLPGIETVLPWPLGFFGKGLVIHVIFSLVIWLLGIFAFLVTLATLGLAEDLRAAPLGRIGQGLVAVAFPCLFAPAFFDATQPELTNYIPLIRHPAYDLGLILLALGVLAPALRLLANLPGRMAALAPLALAMTAASFIYSVALVCFALSGVLLARVGGLQTSRELLFWAGGHVLQFVSATVLVTNWAILARRSLGERAVNRDAFRRSVTLIAMFAIPALMFYPAFPAFSSDQHDAYRFLQYGIVLPTFMFAISLLSNALALGRPAQWPWRDPAFVALATSLALFTVGGVMGMLITSSDTRTPAHYHDVITAVSVSGMGVLLTFALDEMKRLPVSERATRIILMLYGGGQLFASIGMFVAGGYGAPRKAPTSAGVLVDTAAAGMFVHGVGALFAVIGGAAFVVVAIRALRRANPAPASA